MQVLVPPPLLHPGLTSVQREKKLKWKSDCFFYIGILVAGVSGILKWAELPKPYHRTSAALAAAIYWLSGITETKLVLLKLKGKTFTDDVELKIKSTKREFDLFIKFLAVSSLFQCSIFIFFVLPNFFGSLFSYNLYKIKLEDTLRNITSSAMIELANYSQPCAYFKSPCVFLLPLIIVGINACGFLPLILKLRWFPEEMNYAASIAMYGVCFSMSLILGASSFEIPTINPLGDSSMSVAAEQLILVSTKTYSTLRNDLLRALYVPIIYPVLPFFMFALVLFAKQAEGWQYRSNLCFLATIALLLVSAYTDYIPNKLDSLIGDIILLGMARIFRRLMNAQLNKYLIAAAPAEQQVEFSEERLCRSLGRYFRPGR